MTNKAEPLSIPKTATREKPAETIADLRALMVRITRGQSDINLGSKAYVALEEILNLKGDPAMLSITALANRIGVNASTITRLARSLGYDNFVEFRKVLLSSAVAPTNAFYSNQARTALDTTETSNHSKAEQLCRESMANTDRFLNDFDPEAFDLAVDLISNAPRISVFAIRQLHALASFLVYGLRMIRSDVSLLDSNALGLAEGVAALGPEGVLISASCAPYSQQVVATTKVAAENGATIVAITDSPRSPLVKYSKTALFVPHQTSFMSNSLSTFILAAECLINGCAGANPEQTKAALKDRDRLIDALDIEM